MNYVKKNIDDKNTEFTTTDLPYACEVHMKGRWGSEGTIRLNTKVQQCIIDEVKYDLQFREEQEFGKVLTDLRFKRYIRAKLFEHKVACTCGHEKLVYVGSMDQMVVCDECGQGYTEHEYWKILHSVKGVMDSFELMKARYDYGRMSGHERKATEKKLKEELKGIY